MFIMGTSASRIVTAWDLSNATYDNVSFNVDDEDTDPTAIFFSSDGTKMYVLGDDNNTVFQYSLSTAWDLSTASYDSESEYVGDEDTLPTAIFFSSDGTKMYVLGRSNDIIYQYTLSTAWLVSSASYNTFRAIGFVDTSPRGLFFKGDGTKMYVLGQNTEEVHQFTLSTAWLVSSATYDTAYLADQGSGNPEALCFSVDGTKMYVLDANDDVYQYTLSTAWDLSTTSYDSVLFDVGSQNGNPTGIFFKSTGTKMYILGTNGNIVYQYSLD